MGSLSYTSPSALLILRKNPMPLLERATATPKLQNLIVKWSEITKDYEANVTQIFGREIFHQIFDVTLYSALSFKFKGEHVQRGWIDALIISDTRCGKSKTVSSLCKHFKVSPPVQCERASMPGVLGGILQEGGGRQSVIWGAIPRQDKRAVVLEEITGLKTDEISQMSDCRSSGVASLNKIISERCMARTRKLWLSNPRSERNRRMNTYQYGVQAIPEVIGRSEDIARFDFATCAQAEEVSDEVLNAEDRPTAPHIYTSEACHALLFWAWTRTPEQIRFLPGVENLCLRVASEMGKRYNAQIPIVEPGEQRLRVARVAVALAIRFHSTENGTDVLVKEEHVELADWFFRQCYDRPAFGYDRYSKERTRLEVLTPEDAVAATTFFNRFPNAQSVIDVFTGVDVSDRLITNNQHDTASIFSAMLELGLAEATGRGIAKTLKFNAFYTHWQSSRKGQ